MFEHYTEKARRVVFFSRYEASQFGAMNIEPVHLLLGLLREDKALTSRIFPSGATVESLRTRFEQEFPAREKVSVTVDLPLSQPSRRILAYATEEAQRLEHKNIDTAHLLVGMFREESPAARVLREHGLTLERLRAEAVYQAQAEVVPVRRPPPSITVEDPWPSRAGQLHGRATPLIGRQRELERALAILSRRTRNHVAFIGEPGAGKTALVEGLADRISRGDVPPCLVDRPIFSVPAAELVNPGLPDPPDLILAVDGLFNLTIAEPVLFTLAALLARGEVRVVATGTPSGWRQTIEKAGILVRYFEVIDVPPLSGADALEVLKDLKPKYEEFHTVTFSDDAVAMAVRASSLFLPDRPLPERALDLLDDAGARHRARFAKTTPGEIPVITPQDIAEALAQRVAAPGAMVQRVLSEPPVGEIERITAALTAQIPGQSDWLPFVAAWLARCSPQEAERLAHAIRAVRPA